jgi:hypothetical protein
MRLAVLILCALAPAWARADDRVTAIEAKLDEVLPKWTLIHTCSALEPEDAKSTRAFLKAQAAGALQMMAEAGIDRVALARLEERFSTVGMAIDPTRPVSELVAYCGADKRWRQRTRLDMRIYPTVWLRKILKAG